LVPPGTRSPRLLVPLRDYSYGKLFHLEIYFHVNQNHFHKRGYAGGLVLKQRPKFNRKWSTKIQSNTINLSTRLWGINPTNSVVIPQSLVLRSIVLG